MALTPLDIQNKSFSVKMRGYNQDEVDDFLDMIVRDYEEAVQKNRELERCIEPIDHRGSRYRRQSKNERKQRI